ncbi:hypothetical protein WMF31_19955 [Sorangium sp. So ce1036]|uniref:hypothetical protein n=1 Tax=Sorangium sp. So ce1036 TaxID=3133328 RepID=UPI003EFEA570
MAGSRAAARGEDRGPAARQERLVEIHNAKGEVYSIEIGALGLPIAERTFDGREIRYQRDALGRVLLIRRGSESTALERDLAGRVVRKIYDDGAEERFIYNGRGEVILAEGSGCTVELRRNAVGWVIGEKQVVDGEAFQIEVTCDRVGTALRRATSRGHVVENAERCSRGSAFRSTSSGRRARRANTAFTGPRTAEANAPRRGAHASKGKGKSSRAHLVDRGGRARP